PDLKLTLDAGPALRRTIFYVGDEEDRLAGRGSVNLRWSPSPRVTLAQEVAAYVEKANTSVRSTTSLETLLFGPLKARLSHNIQYERDAPPGQKEVDTVSRASVIYSF